MKNLLLEGMPGCGKSTAIIKELKEKNLFPYCAGYRTIRVFDSKRCLRGFAQVPASEENGPEVERITDGPVPNMFLNFAVSRTPAEKVFHEFTVKSLLPAQETRLILIDEMGGRELEIPEVREAYLKALKGPLPVIGVLKSPEHAKHFDCPAYEEFRRKILETDTEICAMTEDTRAETREHIRAWLEGWA